MSGEMWRVGVVHLVVLACALMAVVDFFEQKSARHRKYWLRLWHGFDCVHPMICTRGLHGLGGAARGLIPPAWHWAKQSLARRELGRAGPKWSRARCRPLACTCSLR